MKSLLHKLDKKKTKKKELCKMRNHVLYKYSKRSNRGSSEMSKKRRENFEN